MGLSLWKLRLTPFSDCKRGSSGTIPNVKYLFAALLLTVIPVRAQISATATVTSSVLNASTYHYDVVLKNTGTTTVGTFWFGWVPGVDYLPSAPVNVKSPANWNAAITHFSSADGYAIQWT